MSFQNLSIPAIVGGLAVIAAGLFLLQRLRVRHRPHEVVTTLFWREALEEARARVLVRRFRHPLAYLLLLLIAGLLWIGFAEPSFSAGADEDHVLLVTARRASSPEGGSPRCSRRSTRRPDDPPARPPNRAALRFAPAHAAAPRREHDPPGRAREGRRSGGLSEHGRTHAARRSQRHARATIP